MLKLVTCQDCSTSFEFEHHVGCLPKRCEACRRTAERRRQRAWYAENRQYVLDYARERWLTTTPREKDITCRDCGVRFRLPVVRGRTRSGLCSQCREVARLAAKARYRERNRETLRAKGREYRAWRYANDPDFCERSKRWSYEQRMTNRMAIYERDDGVCHICGFHVEVEEFEVDHVFPRIRGGSSDSSNLKASHRACNRRKAARLLEEVMSVG